MQYYLLLHNVVYDANIRIKSNMIQSNTVQYDSLKTILQFTTVYNIMKHNYIQHDTIKCNIMQFY